MTTVRCGLSESISRVPRGVGSMPAAVYSPLRAIRYPLPQDGPLKANSQLFPTSRVLFALSCSFELVDQALGIGLFAATHKNFTS